MLRLLILLKLFVDGTWRRTGSERLNRRESG